MLRLLSLALVISLVCTCHAQTENDQPGDWNPDSSGLFGYSYPKGADDRSGRVLRFDDTPDLHWPTLLGYPERDYNSEETRKRVLAIKAAYREATEAYKTAKSIGLDGQWYVIKSIKDGDFSRAKIGQQPSDVISIMSPDGSDRLPVG